MKEKLKMLVVMMVLLALVFALPVLAEGQDGQKQTVSAGSPQTVTLNFGTASAGELVISAQGTGTVYIDDVKVYTGITQGDMYHMDGTESSCIQAVRAMNAKVR